MNRKKMTENLAILGSTGSIGTQALEVAKEHNINITSLSAYSNIDLLEQQVKSFRPELVSVGNEVAAMELQKRLSSAGIKLDVLYGLEGMKQVVGIEKADTVLTSVVGIAGLIPTIEAIKKHKRIALANKETLVTAGSVVMGYARQNNVDIIPVDSEHSAIYQALMGNNRAQVNKIILTASGGPFRGYNSKQLEEVTLEQALKHPNWEMGSKITIDSATLMNKGLEVIEAKWLFDMEPKDIEVLVHPQSVIHSMVEFVDGSVLAQLGSPDMRIPIQFALTYPDRMKNSFSKLDFSKTTALTFEKPDTESFRCLSFAFDALKQGGTMPVVLNAANEVAVEKFINKRIKFMDIVRIIDNVMSKHINIKNPELNDIIEADRWARNYITEMEER